jgi:DNA (cytosine-5)-methyltransferase 1
MVVRRQAAKGPGHSSSTRGTFKRHLKHPVIRVGTESSGMEPLPWVFKRIGLLNAFQLVFSCEKDRQCRRLITQCLQAWGPESAQGGTKHVMLTDITTRNPEHLPDHDLYVAGFPCQPFSPLGLREGVSDRHGRGRIIAHIVDALVAKQPRAFILENVRGLVSSHHKTFDYILQKLRSICGQAYDISWRVLNTEEFGVPQHRERVYIVGVKKDAANGNPPFTWPTPISPKPLANFLKDDDKGAMQREATFKANSSPSTKKHLNDLLCKVRADRGNPRSTRCPYVFDIDGSKPHAMKGRCPCITRGRGGSGFYLPSRGRRMTLGERLRLQGLPLAYLQHRQGISDRQLGMMIGNAMSGNVLAHLLSQLLPACGLA